MEHIRNFKNRALITDSIRSTVPYASLKSKKTRVLWLPNDDFPVCTEICIVPGMTEVKHVQKIELPAKYGGGGVYKKLKEVDWEVPWRLFGHDVYKSLGPLLQHHNSPGCGFPEPWKWASPQPSDHWHRYPPEASCVLEKHSSCYKNSIQMDSRSQWHLEIGGRRAGLLTENQECAICP